MFDENKVYKALSQNIAYYEYNTIDGRITVVFHDEYIIDNCTIEEGFVSNEFEVLDESKDDMIKFFDLLKANCSKQQMAFKALHDGVKRWYLLSAFERNEEERVVSGVFQNISSFLLEQDKLIELSKTDPLTGLLNKVNTEKYIDKLIMNRGYFMECLIDLDYFKTINDTYGHIYGDRLLVEIAKKLKEIAGDNGDVGRVGGDEFLLIKRIDHNPSDEERRNLCRAIKNAFYDDRGENVYTSRITSTIGLAVYPFDGKTALDLFRCADKALYRGKVKGRNCYIIYNEQMHGGINTSKPLQDSVLEEMSSFADSSIFINNILASVLLSPTKEKIYSKFVDFAAYFKFQRITVYKRDGEEMTPIHVYDESSRDYDLIKFLDFNSFASQLDSNLFVVSDVFEYKHDRVLKSSCMNIPYEHGTIIISACGQQRSTDYLICYEAFNKRRIWNMNQLNAIKILSKLVTTVILSPVTNKA